MTSIQGGGIVEERCRRLENQVSALKQVSSLRRNLLELREKQAKDLINKLKFYEVIVSEERETRHSLSRRLEASEAQSSELSSRLQQNLNVIDELKTNYENKLSTLISELETSEKRTLQLSDQINCAQLRITEVTQDCTMEELTKQLEEAHRALEDKDKLVKDTQKQLKRVWERNKILSYQMSLLNNLFNETEGVTIDFEKIKAIGDIVRESQTFAEETEEVLSDDEFSERRPSVDLENMIDTFEKSENITPAEIPGEESCYKSVDTKRGPQLVLSVSRTFIKLKDLIVEKKSLQKEIDSLKTLNTKLESKVDKQEHRLYRVTMELNKTWSLVSKLKQQHKRLYNSEAVLRYELQEKRALLEKLKNELSISRDKWRRVRQKNSQSQVEWEKLRDEFAQRKHQSSQESGTFSEVMSVSSSGENEGNEEEPSQSRRGSRNKLEKSQTLPMSFTTSVSAENENAPVDLPEAPIEEITEEPEPPSIEEPEEEGAAALSPSEDTFEDPLEDLVSQLVEDIENEADTEEDSSVASVAPTQLEQDSSPSPDFEDRMRRRANRLAMLEEQCHLLHKKLAASTERSEVLSTKLAKLHDHYGPSGTGTMSDEQSEQPQTSSTSQQNEVGNSTHSSETGASTSSSEIVSVPKISKDANETSEAITSPSSSSSSTENNKKAEAPKSEEAVEVSDVQEQPQGHPLKCDTLLTTVEQAQTDSVTASEIATSADSQATDNGNSETSENPPLQANIETEVISGESADVAIRRVSLPLVSEEIITPEEPVPIIQETVVQHFPSTSEEEANEFLPTQIRPEFLRILQEVDEATNASSLDWMPNLLTITHSVALLRLDQELPSGRNISESLRIEIPRQSPSPPPPTSSQQGRPDGSADEDPEPVPRKDPSFLSRMIIKQLPKRLQLLKNENHTLQMETAEAKMRMKEMKRQLNKEIEKQQQLANSLDTQIEDKTLIEFELREELEQKEKVIEALQMEIDESKKYIDELKKEKDDAEAFLKVFMDEKLDLSQPKETPESIKNCNNCKRPFLLVTRRKLHCKICGKVFCKDCALQREPIKRSTKRPRLCTRCHLRRMRLIVLVNASKQSTST